MKIITDASYKDGKSTHSFIIKDWNNKVMYSEKFGGFADRSSEAELNTIEKALLFCQRKGFKNIKIYTDCKSIVDVVNKEEIVHNDTLESNLNITYLKHLMKTTKAKIRWKPRHYVKLCDKSCKEVYKPRFSRKLHIKKVR